MTKTHVIIEIPASAAEKLKDTDELAKFIAGMHESGFDILEVKWRCDICLQYFPPEQLTLLPDVNKHVCRTCQGYPEEKE